MFLLQFQYELLSWFNWTIALKILVIFEFWYVWNNRNIVGLYVTITFFSQSKFIMQAQTLVINFVKVVIEAYSVYINETSQLVTSFYHAVPYSASVPPHTSKFTRVNVNTPHEYIMNIKAMKINLHST
jgi:hypothetical protein